MANRGGSAKVTTDHDFIRRWVEERGGHPAAVRRTSRPGAPGIIRIDFPGYSGRSSLEKISWDEFFKKFDDSELAFLYQEKLPGGQKSRFSKLVGRETVEARREGGEHTNRRQLRQQGRRGQAAAARKPAGRKPAARKPTTGRKPATARKPAQQARKPGTRRAAATRRRSAA